MGSARSLAWFWFWSWSWSGCRYRAPPSHLSPSPSRGLGKVAVVGEECPGMGGREEGLSQSSSPWPLVPVGPRRREESERGPKTDLSLGRLSSWLVWGPRGGGS